MPPIQPSLRGSLLTGASVFALSVSASAAQAQSISRREVAPPPFNPTFKIWGEGTLLNTAGGAFNGASLPGLPASTTFSPRAGFEGALGFDYRWDRSWHFVFDIRYGKSRTTTRTTGSSSSTIFTTFGIPLGSPFTGYTGFRVNTQADSSTARTTQRESHLVANFMIGRELGLGLGAFRPDVQFGVRIADLRAAATSQINNQSTLTSTTFYSGTTLNIVDQTITTTGTSAFASWKSRFFGIGPRAAIAGGVPISGAWSFDYGGGIAGLIGNRTFNASVFGTAGSFAIGQSGSAFVFNADAMAALSYSFSTQFKVSGGLRGDYYRSALSSFNVSTGAISNIDRLYWGPFVRLTGAF